MGAATVLELVYPAELFPTSLRGSATGFAGAVNRVGAFAGTFLLPIALARFGINMVIFDACALSVVGLSISLPWAPKQKAKRSRDIAPDKKWGPREGAPAVLFLLLPAGSFYRTDRGLSATPST
jgi:hypothetical protein